MRKISKTVGALATASALVAGSASAFEYEGEVHVAYTNMYEFRFVDLGNDLVSAGVDLATEAGPFGVSAGAWYGTFDAPNVIGGNTIGTNWDELDMYAALSYGIGDLSLELGYIYYYFPDQGTSIDTQEFYLGASYDFDFGLSFGSTWYYDFDAYNGWYWDTNIGYSFGINDCLSFDIGAGFAVADGNDLQVSAVPGSNGSADGYQGFYVTAALPWEFRENVTFTPYIKYTDSDSGLVTDLYGNGGQDFLVAGASLAVSF